MKALKRLCRSLLATILALLCAQSAHGFQWSNTELQLQYGNLDTPAFAGGGDATQLIYTLQHASGWKYGDNFLFVDVNDARQPGFQDFDIYGEWYSNFSLGKITGKPIGGGIVSDIGIILGINYGDDAKIRKYAAGMRLSLDIPDSRSPISTPWPFSKAARAWLPGVPRPKTTASLSISTSGALSRSARPVSVSKATLNTGMGATRKSAPEPNLGYSPSRSFAGMRPIESRSASSINSG